MSKVLSRDTTILETDVFTFRLNNEVVELISYDDVVFKTGYEGNTLYTGGTLTDQGNSNYVASKSVISNEVPAGVYEVVITNVILRGLSIPIDYRAGIIVVTLSETDFSDEAHEYKITADISRISIRLKGSTNLVSLAKLPETFFYEEDDYIYTTQGLNYKNIIPSADYYAFPYKPLWSKSPTYSGLIPHFKTIGSVGLSVPITYVDTDRSYGGASAHIIDTLSGLQALQYSTEGDLVYQDEAKAVYSFWNDNHRSTQLNILNDYKNLPNSGVDFLFYRDHQPFTSGLSLADPDPMLDTNTYGWAGHVPWNTSDWEKGLHRHALSGLTADIFDSRRGWFRYLYQNTGKLDEASATVISGSIYEDYDWYAGEIWSYVNRTYNSKQKTFITAVYDRQANEEEIVFAKALALLTDSIYSPGLADYSRSQNYNPSFYSKYTIGYPVTKPIKSGDTIFRQFVNGYVEIIDDGNITADSVTIVTDEAKGLTIIAYYKPTGFNSMYSDSRTYAEISDIDIQQFAESSDYWLGDLEAWNNDSEFSTLKTAMYSYNSSLKVGVTLPFYNWENDYDTSSGIGYELNNILSGVSYNDSASWIEAWNYVLTNGVDVDFYILDESNQVATQPMIAWLDDNRDTNTHFILKTDRTDSGFNHIMTSGVDIDTVQGLLNTGTYVWTDDFNIAAYLKCGYSEYGVEL